MLYQTCFRSLPTHLHERCAQRSEGRGVGGEQRQQRVARQLHNLRADVACGLWQVRVSWLRVPNGVVRQYHLDENTAGG